MKGSSVYSIIVSMLLVIVLVLGIVWTVDGTMEFHFGNEEEETVIDETEDDETEDTDTSADLDIETEDTDTLSLAVKKLDVETLSTSALSLTDSDDKTVLVAYELTATIYPEDATNQEVDYSIAWEDATTYGENDVTDYVDVIQDSDGSLTATVVCYAAFGDDTIKVTVTTRENQLTASCMVYFVGKAETIEITSDDLLVSETDERGEYFALEKSSSYSFDISLDNVFGVVGSYDLSAEVSASGSFYMDMMYYSSTGLVSGGTQSVDLSDHIDDFITSASVSDTTLTITTGSNILSTYASYYFTETGDDGLIYYYYVADTADSCYFTVTVTDSVSGLSEGINLWIVATASSISLSAASIEI